MYLNKQCSETYYHKNDRFPYFDAFDVPRNKIILIPQNIYNW